MMKCDQQLKRLLSYFSIDPVVIDDDLLTIPINDLIMNSKSIGKDDVFIALKGSHVDGHAYIEDAIARGASAILSDTADSQQNKKISYINALKARRIPVISVYNLKEKLSALSHFFYNDPSTSLTIVGVTGTNGKTTVTQLLGQWITLLGEKAAVMGTVGHGLYGRLLPSVNTTMSAVDIQARLADFVKRKVALVAMEVSSHGLVDKRVADVSFDAVVFTNLSRDHLDFHGSMANYAAAKYSLFDQANLAVKERGVAVINYDDQFGRKWLSLLSNSVAVSVNVKKWSQLSKYNRFLGVSDITYKAKGVRLQLVSSWGCALLDSPLMGQFNISNLLMALATLLTLNYSLVSLLAKVGKLRAPPGRMERFISANQPVVIVDYAHTPDALIQALQAARRHCKGTLWVIFGCGGNRDRGKRAIMAKVAEQYADCVMLTQDNPRTENQEQITNDILQGFSKHAKLFIELHRDKAIQKVVKWAKSNDTILVAGKGHEDYQMIGHTRYAYSDREVVARLLGLPL